MCSPFAVGSAFDQTESVGQKYEDVEPVTKAAQSSLGCAPSD